jgi:MFS superfamily sulfate permease-like transporter
MTSAPKPRAGRLLLILSDVQFWIPIAVLAGGLLVLGWIH